MTPSRPRPGAFTVLRVEFVESFVMAMAALAAHKLRSALTLVGVTVGVFSIILVMTAMRGLQQNIEGELSGLGANTFTIERWPAVNFEGPSGWEKFRRRKNLSLAHWQALRDQATRARSVAAVLRWCAWMWAKMARMAAGIMPPGAAASTSRRAAVVPIVCVLPLPVCPYASTVALKPCVYRASSGATISANSARRASPTPPPAPPPAAPGRWPYTRSNVKM